MRLLPLFPLEHSLVQQAHFPPPYPTPAHPPLTRSIVLFIATRIDPSNKTVATLSIIQTKQNPHEGISLHKARHA